MKTCDEDPTQDKCIISCKVKVDQDKCTCTDYPAKPGCDTCEKNPDLDKCKVKNCTEDPSQSFCVFTCKEKLDQPKCNCTNFPRLDHCLCPLNAKKERGIKDFSGKCIWTDESWYDKTLFEIGGVKVTSG